MQNTSIKKKNNTKRILQTCLHKINYSDVHVCEKPKRKITFYVLINKYINKSLLNIYRILFDVNVKNEYQS